MKLRRPCMCESLLDFMSEEKGLQWTTTAASNVHAEADDVDDIEDDELMTLIIMMVMVMVTRVMILIVKNK